VVTLTLLMSVPATAFLKFFARPLTWGQAFTISILCFAITTVGRSSTDSQGTTTNYDASGKVISRETRSGNTTTIYDPACNVGRYTTNR
jgi:YD repeat-containing protein